MTNLEAYTKIIMSAVFRLDGEKIDLCKELNALCDVINSEDETDWFMGEGNEACLSDLIVGAYWAMTECHDGRGEYVTLSKLGTIFKPGMSTPPDKEEPEYLAYYACYEYLIPGSMAESEETEEE